jgi:hypothetical protein
MSNNSQDASEPRFTTHSSFKETSLIVDASRHLREMQLKQLDTPSKPFFGAGGSMLRQFDQHHAGLTRQSSIDSATATPPRSVVGIGGKGVQIKSAVSFELSTTSGVSCETRLL